MKAEPMLEEIEAIKERLAVAAGGDPRLFLEQMDAWLEAHPHAGPAVTSPSQLQTRVKLRETKEPAPAPGEPYRISDPIIAEVHRIRTALLSERHEDPLVLREEPPGPTEPR